MLMTTFRLVALRVFNVTFGRSASFSRLLRRILIFVLVDRRAGAQRYVASSKFFDVGDLV